MSVQECVIVYDLFYRAHVKSSAQVLLISIIVDCCIDFNKTDRNLATLKSRHIAKVVLWLCSKSDCVLDS